MAAFQLTVPQDAISSGDPATATTFIADRGFGRQSSHRVLTANFGDGYEQRVLDGINTKEETFNVAFNNRTASSINLLAAYFDVQAGKNFTFTVTDNAGDTGIKVVCESYNIAYTREGIHSLTTTFRRVYE